jgi:hypothetical protein
MAGLAPFSLPGRGLVSSVYTAVCAPYDWVYIRFFRNGWYWFRPYGGLLGRTPSNQAPAPLTYGLPTGQIKIKSQIKSQSEAA